MSDEADPLYQRLGGLESWASAPVDGDAWAQAVDRLRAFRNEDPARSDMARHYALLAAAHQSAALDGLAATDRGLALSLLRGETGVASLEESVRAHVRSNHDALRLAQGAEVSEPAIRRIHEAACRPQLTHRVRVDDRSQDHVLAGGDYKHHPNHVVTASGALRPTAPVAQVRPEMARMVELVGSGDFAALHPVARAAYVHHALAHVQPFADGNGRVARALAGGHLLRAASIPLVVFADEAAAYEEAAAGPAVLVGFLQRAALTLVDLLCSLEPDRAALERWHAQAGAAAVLRARLVPALTEALGRYRHRPVPGWGADLSVAAVTSGEAVTVRVPLPEDHVVEEMLAVDAHPVDREGIVVLTAEEAHLHLEVRPGGDVPATSGPLGPWLDRVVSCLALRVAAELE